MATDFENVVEMLPDMSDKQRRELKARLAALDTHEDAPEYHSDLYSAVKEELSKKGIKVVPFPMFSKMPLHIRFKDMEPKVDEFIDTHFTITDKRQRLFLYRLFARIAMRYEEELNIPYSVKATVDQLENIGGLFDWQFPGYIECGLQNLVLKAAPDYKTSS